MAPSSLKGLQGYGTFTTRDLKEGEKLLQAPDGPSVIVTDYGYWETRSGLDESEERYEFRKHWVQLWDNYWWGGSSLAAHGRYEAFDAIDFQPTFGCLPNHHCRWSNLYHSYPDVPYQDSFNTITTGRGAFSYHMGRDFRTGREMEAGSEIFLDYGHCDRETETGDFKWTKWAKMKQDYDTASEIVQTIWNALYYFHDNRQSIRSELERVRKNRDWESAGEGKSLMDFSLVKFILYNYRILDEHENHPIKSLIPTTLGDLFWVMDPFVPANDPLSSTNDNDRQQGMELDEEELEELVDRLERKLATNPREPEWIRENGMCLEHIVPRQSAHFPEAGHGGFAQHPIAKGEIVVPAPTLHILQRDVLKHNHPDDQEDSQQYQLLLNYCWGHAKSPLLMCPVTNANLLNHCSDRPGFPCPGDGEGPNAELKWAGDWDPSTKRWLNMSLEEMSQQPIYERGLSLEVIATRDIMPGDEIFLDYGLEWEAAWNQHVHSWEESDYMPEPRLSVTLLNEKVERGLPLEHLVANTLHAKEGDHMDDYLMTTCMYEVSHSDEHPIYETKHLWANDDDKTLLENYAFVGDDYFFEGGYQEAEVDVYWPCIVLKQDNDNNDETDSDITYTVRILPSFFHDEPLWARNEQPRILVKYPLSSIRYFPRPYHSDQHIQNAFRHYMVLPDAMVPDHWKTL